MKILCFLLGHKWALEWFGKDWYLKKKRNYEGTACRRCRHPGMRFEDGKRVPLLTERGRPAPSALGSSPR